MSGSEIDALIIDYLVGDIQAGELEKLEQLLERDSAARERYARLCEQDLALHQALVSESSITQTEHATVSTGIDVQRRSKIRLNIWFAAAALLFLSVTLFVYRFIQGSAAVAHITQASAGVLIVRDGKKLAAVPASEIRSRDEIQVSAKSSAKIVYDDTTTLEIGAESETDVYFQEHAQIAARLAGSKGKRLFIAHGAVSAAVSKQPMGQPMLFLTEHGDACVLGTQLKLDVDGDSTRLEVTEGKVRLSNLEQKFVDVDAGNSAVTSSKAIALETTEDRLSWVIRKLKQLNPGFDGKVESKIVDGSIRELKFSGCNVSNLSPLRGLKNLEALNCSGTNEITSPLTDLNPLRGLPLKQLTLNQTQISDLTPLKGLPLERLFLEACPRLTDISPLKGLALTEISVGACKGVSDLSPLAGMKLSALHAQYTSVADLTPLKGMPLRHLELFATKISDLSPLTGMPLEVFYCSYTDVSDLTPLKNMPLRSLRCQMSKVRDMSPLKDLLLNDLTCDYVPERDREILRGLKHLAWLNDRPAAEALK